MTRTGGRGKRDCPWPARAAVVSRRLPSGIIALGLVHRWMLSPAVPGIMPVFRRGSAPMPEPVATCSERITQDPGVMVGKPVVRGTRIPVERVIAHLAQNPLLDDLFAAYPELTLDDVKACLRYAHAAVERHDRRAARKLVATAGHR
jgi:uncharacterized protein (DUF433 family)